MIGMDVSVQKEAAPTLLIQSGDYRLLELDRVRIIGSLCFPSVLLTMVIPCQIGW